MRRIFIGSLVVLAIAAFAGRHEAHAEPAPTPAYTTACIMYEDDSFQCGHVLYWDTDGQPAIDHNRPFIVGCVPDALCDSPDGAVGESFDGLYSEVVFPLDDPRYPTE